MQGTMRSQRFQTKFQEPTYAFVRWHEIESTELLAKRACVPCTNTAVAAMHGQLQGYRIRTISCCAAQVLTLVCFLLLSISVLGRNRAVLRGWDPPRHR